MDSLSLHPSVDETVSGDLAHGGSLNNLERSETVHALEVDLQVLQVAHSAVYSDEIRLRSSILTVFVEKLVEGRFGCRRRV